MTIQASNQKITIYEYDEQSGEYVETLSLQGFAAECYLESIGE